MALYIAGVQWIDALTPPINAQIARLAAAILPMVGDVRPCPPPTPLPASPQPHRSWRLGIAAVAACLVLAAVILLMLRPELGSWAGGKKSSNQPEAGPSSGQAEKPIARVTAPLPAPQPKASPSGRQAKKARSGHNAHALCAIATGPWHQNPRANQTRARQADKPRRRTPAQCPRLPRHRRSQARPSMPANHRTSRTRPRRLGTQMRAACRLYRLRRKELRPTCRPCSGSSCPCTSV